MLMEKFKHCLKCGFKMLGGDRFCSNCGLDILRSNQGQKKNASQGARRQAPNQNQQRPQPNQRPNQNQNTRPNMNYQGPGAPKNSNTGLIIAIVALVALLVIGGGIYAVVSLRAPKEDPPISSNSQNGQDTKTEEGVGRSSGTDEKKPTKVDEGSNQSQLDLSKARTYLPKSGIKASFFVNYPDGMSGIVDRISSSLAPDPSIIVTEVEVGIDMGEEYGFGSHYIEREDGTYVVYDNSPYEMMPVLKNDLYLGKSWEYVGGYGNIVWTVSSMGTRLDLGFKVFEDCIVIKEDNQAVGFQSLTYYAPEYGIVRVVDSGGAMEYYSMTSLEDIGEEAASQAVRKWAPNYMNISDGGTQLY